MGNQQLFRDSLQLHQLEMAHGIEKCVAKTGDWPTPIQDVLFFRRDAVSQPDFCLIEPSLVMVVQGEKQILVGDHAYPYNPTNFLITSLDLPASSQVVSASKAIPCLGLVVKIDVQTLTELVPMIPREHLNRQKRQTALAWEK